MTFADARRRGSLVATMMVERQHQGVARELSRAADEEWRQYLALMARHDFVNAAHSLQVWCALFNAASTARIAEARARVEIAKRRAWQEGD